MSEAAIDERKPVTELTDRELLEEIALHSRSVADLVNGFFGDLRSGKINPMQMMMGIMKGK
jgi:hypothetical protein